MKLIIGLGNPGKEYINSRHNSGWRVVDKIIQKLNIKNKKEKFDAFIYETFAKDEKVILVKPQTFMNASGLAVKQMIKWLNDKMFKFSSDLWVIHDDMDIPSGEIRIVKNRQSAGHKGVNSIITQLGTQDFIRFRLGIGRNRTMDEKVYVLEKPYGEEKDLFEKSLGLGVEAVLYALENGVDKAMNKYN